MIMKMIHSSLSEEEEMDGDMTDWVAEVDS